jgi:hypothetical protein
MRVRLRMGALASARAQVRRARSVHRRVRGVRLGRGHRNADRVRHQRWEHRAVPGVDPAGRKRSGGHPPTDHDCAGASAPTGDRASAPHQPKVQRHPAGRRKPVHPRQRTDGYRARSLRAVVRARLARPRAGRWRPQGLVDLERHVHRAHGSPLAYTAGISAASTASVTFAGPRRMTPVSRMTRCARATGITVTIITKKATTLTTGSCCPR